jgi:hypothetical protein
LTITRDTTLYALWNGDGRSPEHPKLASTKEDLLNIGEEDNIALVSEVDGMDGVILPSEQTPFLGTFDGRGHTVTLNINQTTWSDYFTYIGLFGTIRNNAVIQNVHVRGSITVNFSIGPTSIFVGGIVGASVNATITLKNCASSVNITVTVSPFLFVGVGGLTGYVGYGITAEHCYTSGTITTTYPGPTEGTLHFTGGIAGIINGGDGVILNNVSLCNIVQTDTRPYSSDAQGVRRIIGGTNIADMTIPTTGSYALGTITMTANGVDVLSQQPANADWDGIPAAAADVDSETWWRTTAGWETVWGGESPTTEKPWVWDAAAKRPKLHTFN